MKTKFALMVLGVLFSSAVFCQDSVSSRHNKVTLKNQSQLPTTLGDKTSTNNNSTNQNHIYRDTRLGSSSPMYNTYKKNDYGAGGVTTDPNKGKSGSPVLTPSVTDSIKH